MYWFMPRNNSQNWLIKYKFFNYLTKTEFNKPSPLRIMRNMPQNFKFFKQQAEIYMTVTETDDKPKWVQVVRLLNMISTKALKGIL